jgi:hypothetical protein
MPSHALRLLADKAQRPPTADLRLNGADNTANGGCDGTLGYRRTAGY